MTPYSEAAKRRAKRAQKALRAACAISGVNISAEASSPRRGGPVAKETAMQATETAHHNICREMGWPWSVANRARCRAAHMGTLYGRLFEAGRIDRDAYNGIEAWERLDNALRREVLGARIAPVDYVIHDGEARDPERIKAERAAAWAVLTRSGQMQAQLVIAVCVNPTEWPRNWPQAYDAPLGKAGHALARHFGLRA